MSLCKYDSLKKKDFGLGFKIFKTKKDLFREYGSLTHFFNLRVTIYPRVAPKTIYVIKHFGSKIHCDRGEEATLW